MNSALATEDDLKRWTGYNRRGDLRRWLRDSKVPFRIGKGGTICVCISDLPIHNSQGHSSGDLELDDQNG